MNCYQFPASTYQCDWDDCERVPRFRRWSRKHLRWLHVCEDHRAERMPDRLDSRIASARERDRLRAEDEHTHGYRRR